MVAVSRAEALSYRVRAQQLDRASGSLSETAILDIGAQDTGPDGGLWALALRGVDTSALTGADLATVWSVRGAPHLYRRADLPSVAAAVQPYSEADAAKRILNASKPLQAAGITALDALDTVGRQMRSVVTEPMAKGAVSTALTERLDDPYLRFCRPCNAVHAYEMTFRLGALRGGLELQPGTSPPVLQRAPGFARAAAAEARHDLVRGYLRMLGPATPHHVAGYLDAPAGDVREHWPDDAVKVTVEGETRWLLDADLAAAEGASAGADRLLGPFDLFLQARDRALLVADPSRAKALWPVLGRPGGVLLGHEVAGLWRPRKSGTQLTLSVDLWVRRTRVVAAAVEAQAERLAAFRGAALKAVDYGP